MDQALNSQKTPHTSPLRASYGMSFVSILMKNDRVIKGFYCTRIHSGYLRVWIWLRAFNITYIYILTRCTVYPKKYAHGFVVLCFVVVMQSFIMNSHEVFIHIHQGCFAGTGAIVRLPQCQWSKPDGYGKISQCITTTKHSKAKTVCIFLGIYCKGNRYPSRYIVRMSSELA